jgi:hypothetical protein
MAQTEQEIISKVHETALSLIDRGVWKKEDVSGDSLIKPVRDLVLTQFGYGETSWENVEQVDKFTICTLTKETIDRLRETLEHQKQEHFGRSIVRTPDGVVEVERINPHRDTGYK